MSDSVLTDRPARAASPAQWRDLSLVTAMVLLASLLFIGKGPRIDDLVYLGVANRIVSDPWRPYPVERVRAERNFEINNPPLQQYLLAGVIAGAGENMAALHAVTALFLLVAGLAMYGVARRFCDQPLAATAMLIMSPAVLPSQNLMLDIPLLALELVSIYFYVRGTDEGSMPLAMLGGAFLGLAFLTKFNALPVAPLLAIYALLKRRPRFLLALLPAVAIVGLWAAHDLAVYGVTQITSRRDPSPLRAVLGHPVNLLLRVLFTLSCLGAGCFLPLFLVPKRSWRRAALAGLVIAAAAVPYLYAWHRGKVTPIHVIVATGLLAAGMMAFVLILLRVPNWLARSAANDSRLSDELFLVAWIAGIAAFTILFAPFIAIRHYIPALPALIILSCRMLAGSPAKANGRIILTACCILTAVAGLAVARADYLHAGVYEPLARDAARRCAAEIPEGKAFFVGAWEWGYWAAKNGLKRLPGLDPALRAGDMVVFPRTAWITRREILQAAGLQPVETYVMSSRWPVRTFDENMSGYYAMKYFWTSPYTLSPAPIEELRVARCGRDVQLEGDFY